MDNNMNILFKDYTYDKDSDILIRVYDNQSKTFTEKEQCVGEILFKQHLSSEHYMISSWLPRGLAEGIIKYLFQIKLDTNVKIQVSNELPPNVGVLTSCRENFDKSFKCIFEEYNQIKHDINFLNINDPIPFGKYKGITCFELLENINSEKLSYLEWLFKNTKLSPSNEIKVKMGELYGL